MATDWNALKKQNENFIGKIVFVNKFCIGRDVYLHNFLFFVDSIDDNDCRELFGTVIKTDNKFFLNRKICVFHYGDVEISIVSGPLWENRL